MARKTKLTKEVQEQICKYIEIGVPIKFAAEACGISERTFYNWMERGEKENKGCFFQFFQSVKKALAKSVARDIAIIEKAAQEGKWQASAWRLERRHPEFFGVKEHHHLEHSGKIDIELFKKYLQTNDKNEKKEEKK